jgi:hypothetical protein
MVALHNSIETVDFSRYNRSTSTRKTKYGKENETLYVECKMFHPAYPGY